MAACAGVGFACLRSRGNSQTKDDISGKKADIESITVIAAAIKQLQILKHSSSALHYWHQKLFSLCLVCT